MKRPGTPASTFFAGRSFHQERTVMPVIPMSHARPIISISLDTIDDAEGWREVTDDDSRDCWSPAQAKDYRRSA